MIEDGVEYQPTLPIEKESVVKYKAIIIIDTEIFWLVLWSKKLI